MLKVIVLVIGLSLMGFITKAEETNVKVPVPEGYEPLKMEGMPTEAPKVKSKINFSASCVDNHGRTIQQGEAGYDACLGQVKLKSLHQGNGSDKANTMNPGPQMNMNLNLGN